MKLKDIEIGMKLRVLPMTDPEDWNGDEWPTGKTGVVDKIDRGDGYPIHLMSDCKEIRENWFGFRELEPVEEDEATGIR